MNYEKLNDAKQVDVEWTSGYTIYRRKEVFLCISHLTPRDLEDKRQIV